MNSLPTIPDEYCTCSSYYGHLQQRYTLDDFNGSMDSEFFESGNSSMPDNALELLDDILTVPDPLIWSEKLLLSVAYISTGTDYNLVGHVTALFQLVLKILGSLCTIIFCVIIFNIYFTSEKFVKSIFP